MSVGTPFLITQVHLKTWAARLAAVVALSLASQCLVLWFGKLRRFGLMRLRRAVPALLIFGLTAGSIIATVLIQGTAFSSLIAGVITRPARTPRLWYLEVKLDPLTIPFAIAGLLQLLVTSPTLTRVAIKLNQERLLLLEN